MTALAALLAAAAVQIVGDLPRTGALTEQDLQALGPVKSRWKVGGREHEVEGVPLSAVLEKFGFEPGPMGPKLLPADKVAGWKKALIVTARDGFQAVFSCAELFESMGPTRALLVYRMNGQPLPADTGPFRIAVLTDKDTSRSVFAVEKLEVRDLRTKGGR